MSRNFGFTRRLAIDLRRHSSALCRWAALTN
ncbi:putative leader peptide [Parafrankia colletiae]